MQVKKFDREFGKNENMLHALKEATPDFDGNYAFADDLKMSANARDELIQQITRRQKEIVLEIMIGLPEDFCHDSTGRWALTARARADVQRWCWR